ncbi:MAG TPA: hypothetical protein VEJ84_13930 [Acidimicrobiales bacterium]|nr:hypothetical protein [Acidimicrobiales bacterium]
MKNVLSWLVRRGWQRGFLEGDQFWLVVGAAALLVQWGIRAGNKKPRVVFSEPLSVGETLVISHQRRLRNNGRREDPFEEP